MNAAIIYMRFQIKRFHSRFPSDDLNPNGIDLNYVLGIISHIWKCAVVILGQSPGSEASVAYRDFDAENSGTQNRDTVSITLILEITK